MHGARVGGACRGPMEYVPGRVRASAAASARAVVRDVSLGRGSRRRAPPRVATNVTPNAVRRARSSVVRTATSPSRTRLGRETPAPPPVVRARIIPRVRLCARDHPRCTHLQYSRKIQRSGLARVRFCLSNFFCFSSAYRAHVRVLYAYVSGARVTRNLPFTPTSSVVPVRTWVKARSVCASDDATTISCRAIRARSRVAAVETRAPAAPRAKLRWISRTRTSCCRTRRWPWTTRPRRSSGTRPPTWATTITTRPAAGPAAVARPGPPRSAPRGSCRPTCACRSPNRISRSSNPGQCARRNRALFLVTIIIRLLPVKCS